jgi:hypothetical protein
MDLDPANSTSKRSFQLARLSRNTTLELGKTSKVLPSETSKTANPSAPLKNDLARLHRVAHAQSPWGTIPKNGNLAGEAAQCAAAEVWAHAEMAHTASAATSFDNSFVEPLGIRLPARSATLQQAQSSIKTALQVLDRRSEVAINRKES